jgi:hypothetical protein
LAVVASLRKEEDLKDFVMSVCMRLGLSRARIEVTAMLDIGVDENFISYRFLLEAGWELTRSLE